jgi:hypothetical protein
VIHDHQTMTMFDQVAGNSMAHQADTHHANARTYLDFDVLPIRQFEYGANGRHGSPCGIMAS